MDEGSTQTSGSWLGQRARSVGYAVRGLIAQIATQPNSRIHLAATLVVAALGFWCRIAAWEWCAVLGAAGLVWIAEGLNTAVETLADHVAPGQHPLVGRAKDLAAGAVLAASVIAAIIGAIVFVPRFL